MVQQDLFAPKPAPPMRTRSEAGGIVPFHSGPVSHATGGPLSAEEAERVVTLRTIRVSDYQFQDGSAVCKACWDGALDQDFLAKGRGYRGALYGGAEYKGGLECCVCSKPIKP